MSLPMLRSAEDTRALVEKVGIIPLFRSCVPGFSIEELTPEEHWFKEGVEGPWEWREALAASGDVAYGKLLSNKAALISLSLYPYFCNMRRAGYDFDARVEDGLVPDRDRRLYALIEGNVSASHALRKAYGDKGYEAALTRLQMMTYVTVAGFTRRRDRFGMPYGWGISMYQTSEARFEGICAGAYHEEPEASREKILQTLEKYMSRGDAAQLIAYKG